MMNNTQQKEKNVTIKNRQNVASQVCLYVHSG